MKEVKFYELIPSQEVVTLQCKYSLFKRIVNILSSMSTEESIDFDIMKEAFNEVVKRNDCLRLRFCKKDGKLQQYFIDEDKFENIPCITFDTKKQQDAFMSKIKKSAIKYMKGKVIEPYFIKTYDKKCMIFLKVCHLVLDIYGINMIFKDLFEVYEALKNNTPLPTKLESFEEIINKELNKRQNKERHDKNLEFFQNLLSSKDEPYYAGIHGDQKPLWKKQVEKNKHCMKMFFIKNDTKEYTHFIDKELTTKVIEYSKKAGFSPANILFYAMSVCASKINNNIKNMIPLELCNCRGTALEKNCAGAKAQSIACYTSVEHDKSFLENLEKFCNDQTKLFRHIGFSDQEFVMLLHKTYNSSFFETYYSIAYSFIPCIKPTNMDLNIYSNGKCALPAYIGQMYDINNGNIQMIYDCQTKIISEKDVEDYHDKYLKLLNQIVENPNIIINDIQL